MGETWGDYGMEVDQEEDNQRYPAHPSRDSILDPQRHETNKDGLRALSDSIHSS